MSGYFISSYRFELLLAAPLIAYSMAYYLRLGFIKNNFIQYPERLFREKRLMLTVGMVFLACTVHLFFDMEWLKLFLAPRIQPDVFLQVCISSLSPA